MRGLATVCGCCINAPWLQHLQVNWMCRRHSWRLTLYYYCFGGLCCIGVLLTFVLHVLTSPDSFFFVNYRCAYRTKQLIRANFVCMMILGSALALLGLLTLRMIRLFISHTLSEFKPTGYVMAGVGCLVKWLPWTIAVLTIAIVIINISNTIWITSSPDNWCARRWSTLALQAVKNCRLWFSGSAACLKTAERVELADNATKCNDGDFLKSAYFFYFIPKSNVGSCSLSETGVCLLYKNSYSTLAVDTTPDWTAGGAEECEGLNSKDKAVDDFLATGHSDIYKYLLIYTVAWGFALLCTLFFFFYIKLTSHFEGYFCQPPSKTKHILLVPIRPFTPWDH